MKLINPTEHKRLNEATGFVLLSVGLFLWLSLLSYHDQDPSWNTATGAVRPLNLTGYPGSYAADLLLQGFGLAAFLFPILALLLAWKWLRSESFQAPAAKLTGAIAFLLGSAAALSFGPDWRLFSGAIRLGGVMGLVVADALIGWLNTTGAILADATILIVAIYLISSFTVEKFVKFLMPLVRAISSLMDRWGAWNADSARRRKEIGRASCRERV